MNRNVDPWLNFKESLLDKRIIEASIELYFRGQGVSIEQVAQELAEHPNRIARRWAHLREADVPLLFRAKPGMNQALAGLVEHFERTLQWAILDRVDALSKDGSL